MPCGGCIAVGDVPLQLPVKDGVPFPIGKGNVVHPCLVQRGLNHGVHQCLFTAQLRDCAAGNGQQPIISVDGHVVPGIVRILAGIADAHGDRLPVCVGDLCDDSRVVQPEVRKVILIVRRILCQHILIGDGSGNQQQVISGVCVHRPAVSIHQVGAVILPGHAPSFAAAQGQLHMLHICAFLRSNGSAGVFIFRHIHRAFLIQYMVQGNAPCQQHKGKEKG